ncbi:putative hydrolase of the HAD superfamily [Metabacillus niabensis]|uniref:Hydrolase of the HAD superfamily n=2 Tax=Metabacillus niabensis TaxID=324854 RepID=A0ABT9Z238_9BACI|nr:putative hydrolase of the HAD superfamily [Metabacillus niabensis]
MDNINSLRMKTYFATILVSEWEKMRKPDPRLFLRALDRLNVAPHESIFIGDHPENDVKAAKEVGMIGIWKKSIYWKSADTDLVIDELDEIPAIIEKLNSKSFA